MVRLHVKTGVTQAGTPQIDEACLKPALWQSWHAQRQLHEPLAAIGNPHNDLDSWRP
jgi:hypothetical protein